jgi:hypothetical protein
MKDYYGVLRVSRTASTVEIRRSYRSLVQQFHPDVNPDPAAHEHIKEINEAYDVLGDEAKRYAYDLRLANPFVEATPQPPSHRDPAYRRRAAYRAPTPKGSTQYDLMQKYVQLGAYAAWAGCLLSALLFIDYVIPHTVTHATVETFHSGGTSRARNYYLITHEGQSLKISDRDIKKFVLDQRIEIIESRLLLVLKEIYIPETGASITNLSTVYCNFAFVPLFLVGFSVLGAAQKGGVEFRFNLGLLNFFVLIFTLILLLK